MPKDDDEKREAEERKHMLMKKTIHTASHGKITLPVSCTEKSFGFKFWNSTRISKSGTRTQNSFNCLQMEMMGYKKNNSCL